MPRWVLAELSSTRHRELYDALKCYQITQAGLVGPLGTGPDVLLIASIYGDWSMRLSPDDRSALLGCAVSGLELF